MNPAILFVGLFVLLGVGFLIFFFLSKKPDGPVDPDGPKRCQDTTPCKNSNGDCVILCAGQDELDQCPLDDDTCQKCPAGSKISADRSSCEETHDCLSPHKLCGHVCVDKDDLCWNGDCPGVDCPPDADAIWRAFMELLKGLFTAQGMTTMVEFHAFAMAVQGLKGILESGSASFTEDAIVAKLKEKVANLSTKVGEHLVASNPLYRFISRMPGLGLAQFFKRKKAFNLKRSLKIIPEFREKTDEEIAQILADLSDERLEAVAAKLAEDPLIGLSLKEVGSGVIKRNIGKGMRLLAQGIDPAMYVLDGLMFAGMVEDMLGLGGWTRVFNTDTIYESMHTNNQDFVDGCIESIGLYPVVVGPLVYYAMQFEAGEVEQPLDALIMSKLAEDFPFRGDGTPSPLFLYLVNQLYNQWIVDQGMSGEEIGNVFSDLIHNLPLYQSAPLIEEAEKQLCEEMEGVYFDPFNGAYTDPLPPWGKVCTFKDAATTETKNAWFPGRGAKYSNFEWRSRTDLEAIPLMFENTDGVPVHLQFPVNTDNGIPITGAAILVDDAPHRFCNTGQDVDFPGLHSREIFTTYQQYDSSTGICHNHPNQCKLWGMKDEPVIINGTSYTNCVPRDGAGAAISRFFIGDSLLQQANSSANQTSANYDPNSQNCEDILAEDVVDPSKINSHYTPPN